MATKIICTTLLALAVAKSEGVKNFRRSALLGEHSSLESASGSSGWSSFGSLGLGNELDHGGMFSASIDSGSSSTLYSGLTHALSSVALPGASGLSDGIGSGLTSGPGTQLGSVGGPSFLDGATRGLSPGLDGGELSSLPTLGVGAPIPLGEHVTLVRRIAVPVPHPVPFAVPRDVPVAVPQAVPVPVDRPVPQPVPQPYPVPVVKHVPVPVEQKVAVPVPEPVAVPVFRPVAVAVAQPVPVPVVKEVPVPVYAQRQQWKEQW